LKRVLIILGSKTDEPVCKGATEILTSFDLDYEFQVSSAHRNPERTMQLARQAEAEGFEVIIAAAGMAAHLPGVIAAHSVLPVIGLPIASGALNGVDALYSIVQMPPGVPVACVGINNARNAALLAIQILAGKDAELREKFRIYKASLANPA